MELKTLSQAQVDLLNKPLPAEAVTPHPTKKFLSSIKSIYVTERLNEVFGVGRWRIKSEIIENTDKMIVVKAFFSVPEYGIDYECYGGNDNADRGDAYKGATTDAITKIGSWLGIGADVFKGKHGVKSTPATATQPQRKTIGAKELDDVTKCNALLEWVFGKYSKAEDKKAFNAAQVLAQSYEVSEHNQKRFNQLFISFVQAKNNVA
jgi:hypothetical protein